MNMKRSVSLACVMAVGFAASALAGPNCKQPCGKKRAKTVAEKSDTTVGAKKGCCSKGAKDAKLAKSAADMPCHAKKGELAGSKKGCASKCGSKGANKVLASMPGMTYRIGDFETGCHMTASAKAEESKKPIVYMVAGKAYDGEGSATEALVEVLESRAKELVEVQFVAGEERFRCPVSAEAAAKKAKTNVTYRLAGFNIEDRAKAMKLAEEAEKAAATVKMTFMSEGKAVPCAKTCKESGKEVTYVVGDEKTGCEKTAKLLLAQRKLRAIVETVSGSAS